MTKGQPGRAETWTEAASKEFLDYGRYFVPERELQIATICDLIPPPAGPCHIVELCSGEGLLSRAVLERFPAAHVHAFDGSPRMLARTRKVAGEHGERLETAHFDLANGAWRTFPWPVHAVVSMLAIHHLDGPQKRALFADMARALEPGGAFIIADLVAPTSDLAKRLAAKTWDDEVRRRAFELDQDLKAFERFCTDRWNYYSDPEPDPIDKPSTLLEQLAWLGRAGFTAVDVYWMKAGHAILGGRKPRV